MILIILESNIENLHKDIEIIKSLLLNQNQFPPIPENFKRSVENVENKIIQNEIDENEIVENETQKNK